MVRVSIFCMLWVMYIWIRVRYRFKVLVVFVFIDRVNERDFCFVNVDYEFCLCG